MTTFIDFSPSSTSAFIFQAELDGNTHDVIVSWSLYRRGYYINVYTLQNVLVVCIPMVGSPLDYDINLVKGFFDASSLVWRPESQQIEVRP